MAAADRFEGEAVAGFQAKLPSMTVESDRSFAHGEIVRLEVEARVRGVRLEEDREGRLQRIHVLSFEDIAVAGTAKPEDVVAVGGGLSAGHADTRPNTPPNTPPNGPPNARPLVEVLAEFPVGELEAEAL